MYVCMYVLPNNESPFSLLFYALFSAFEICTYMHIDKYM